MGRLCRQGEATVDILVIMCAGAVVGRLFVPASVKRVNELFQTCCTALLIFAMGISLGAQDDFLSNLGVFGAQSLVFCLLPTACSVILVYLLTNWLMGDGKPDPSVGAHPGTTGGIARRIRAVVHEEGFAIMAFIALALGIAFVMPEFHMPAFTEFVKGGGPIVGGPVIPFIFITIACGALSGFHATIGTGTTPKMISNERDVLFVGYGAMLMEGFVAVMALVAACVLVPADYFAINAPADKFAQLGMQVVELPHLEAQVQETLMSRPGGSVSLAVGMAHIFSKIPFMEDLMAYWYHFAIMFEAVFILTAVDAGTRVGRFFLQEMMGKVWPKFADKEWWPGIIITSVIFTGAWGYLVYSGDIGSIWPLFGICNQLLASVTLLIGTTVILRMNKTQYAWITGVPGVFMTIITFWAGIWLVVNQYLPAGQYLLAVLSVLVMFLMLFVIVGTVRRWIVLLGIHTTVKDEYGDEVKVLVAE